MRRAGGSRPEDRLDRAKLAELRAMMPARFVGESIVLFLDRAPRSMAALEEALARGDLHQLERRAHGLKGSAAIIGARRVMELSGEVETAVRRGKSDDLPALMASLAEELPHTRAELERELADLGGS